MNGTSFQSDIRYWLRQGNTVNHLLLWNIIIFLGIKTLEVIQTFSPGNTAFAWTFEQLALHSHPGTFLIKPWGLITYMFTHVGIFHIFFNMLNLYWFGNLFRSFLGNRRILPLYLLGGIAGGVLYLLCYNLFLGSTDAVMIGASASVMCILVACATLMPNYEIGLLFLGSIRLKWLALALIVLGLVSIPQGNLGGIISHMGGALLGFFYIRILQNGTDLCKPLIWLFDAETRAESKKRQARFKPKKSPLKVVKKPDDNNQLKLDQLLDKINEKGYHSLSAEEKAWLDKVSKEN
ncbi:rhomboid family intramembrane serine protease [Chitinophaga sp. Mgbs1]|uniref:Rhomboid family intramembrane serine protease n=1 Tax=Chitinophaga solisilvae TaxID=1233460 RepID=A0A3S1CVX3_9BACT|nr:rhomboid family intramembrane serine protease [Chitinophaga solisilvae]